MIRRENGDLVNYSHYDQLNSLKENQHLLFKEIKEIYKEMISLHSYLIQKKKTLNDNIQIFTNLIEKLDKKIEHQ